MKSKFEALDPNLRKHLLVGAGLGLYLGMFFRPAREPSLMIVLGLSTLITIVMFVFQLFRKDRPPFLTMLKELPLTFLQYVLILMVFEGRHYAWDIGGRLLTSIFTTVMGTVSGALIYWKGSGKSSLI